MSYALFIDDERFPAAVPNRDGNYWTMDPARAVRTDRQGRPWRIARSMEEVRATLAAQGAPVHASFDHDLGADTPSGHDIAKMLVEADLDARAGQPSIFRFPPGFTCTVHSMNPVGATNIAAYLGQYLALRAAETEKE